MVTSSIPEGVSNSFIILAVLTLPTIPIYLLGLLMGRFLQLEPPTKRALYSTGLAMLVYFILDVLLRFAALIILYLPGAFLGFLLLKRHYLKIAKLRGAPISG